MFTFLSTPLFSTVKERMLTVTLLDPLEQFDVLAAPLPILWGVGITNLTVLLTLNLLIMWG